MQRKSFHELARILQSIMEEALPSMVGDRVNEIAKKTKERENLHVEITLQVNNAIANSIPLQMDGFGIDDDEVPTEEVSHELWEEISGEGDKAQLQKAINDMLRQRCNSGEEHQYHVDQMHNYLKSDIIWESRKERLSLPTPQVPAPIYHSCQRDPKAPPMTLLNQDMFYLKYDRTSRWVSKRIRRFNMYARYSVEHWKNLWAKQFHIRRHKEKREKPEEVYSDSKIVEVIRFSYELVVVLREELPEFLQGGGELLKRRVVTKQRVAYWRFAYQRVAYQRFVYRRFEQAHGSNSVLRCQVGTSACKAQAIVLFSDLVS
ncbi:hypothetical protein Tco_0002326 [Tanacetum coccineum]